MIFTITVKTCEGNTEHNKFGREVAEGFADLAYSCENVYAVEVINAETGEIVYYKAKG